MEKLSDQPRITQLLTGNDDSNAPVEQRRSEGGEFKEAENHWEIEVKSLGVTCSSLSWGCLETQDAIIR